MLWNAAIDLLVPTSGPPRPARPATSDAGTKQRPLLQG